MNWNSLTYNTIKDGPVITEAVFNYTKITAALDRLAEKAGFIWYIDYDKSLHFVERSTFKAPFTLIASDTKKGSLSVEEGNPLYRNRQYIKGGRDITDELTENKRGDGKTRAWVVGFPIAKVPRLKLNGVDIAVSDVGIRGLDKDKKYYWSKSSNTISQDDSETLLEGTDILEITYQGEFDIVILSTNFEGVADKQALEGGTGFVEMVEDDTSIENARSGFELANAKLKKYSVDGKKLRFITWKHGLAAGQLLTVDLPEYGLNNEELLIDSVNIRYEDNMYWYDVQAVYGPSNGSWAKLFYHMATRGQAFVIRENISETQVLVTLVTFEKTWSESENPNIFRELFAADNLFPSDNLFPMFAQAERVKYVELLDANGVIIRKRITKQTGIEVLSSIIYIAPFEANTQIETVKFYGGIGATDTNGTGVVIDSIGYSKLKTQLEAIQIDRTDIRDFTPATGVKELSSAYFTGIDNAVNTYLTNSQ